MQVPDLHLAVLGPIAWLGIGAMLILMLEVFLSRAGSESGDRPSDSKIGSYIVAAAIVTLLFALYMACVAFAGGDTATFNPSNVMFQLDPFSSFVTALLCIAAILSCALSHSYLEELRINHGEYYALVLLSTAGMLLMVSAVDFIAVFLGLELMSIPLYVLAGFDRRKLRSNEAAIKYFLIGAFASAIMLYGMAFLYGAVGETSFAALRAAFDPGDPIALIGLGLVVVGFAFKISSVPFHQWTPDVYEGAPTAVTAFMSVTVKAASFAALLRLLVLALPETLDKLHGVLWVLSAATMVVGNVMAVIQENVKRMLAYSSIAHAGYILIGFVTATADGYAAVVFYLIAYTFMNLGAFSVVVVLAHRGKDCDRMESFAGLARTRPGLAAMMTVFMVSLAGIPGTVGFIGKFTIFTAAAEAGEIPLMLLGVMTSVVSVYYYLRLTVLMYMREPGEETHRLETHSLEGGVLVVCTFIVLFLGIFPNNNWLPLIGGFTVLDWARQSVSIFFTS